LRWSLGAGGEREAEQGCESGWRKTGHALGFMVRRFGWVKVNVFRGRVLAGLDGCFGLR
jgi:hypothetical protein